MSLRMGHYNSRVTTPEGKEQLWVVMKKGKNIDRFNPLHRIILIASEKNIDISSLSMDIRPQYHRNVVWLGKGRTDLGDGQHRLRVIWEKHRQLLDDEHASMETLYTQAKKGSEVEEDITARIRLIAKERAIGGYWVVKIYSRGMSRI